MSKVAVEVWRGRHLGPGSPRPHRACRAAPRRRPPSSTARRPASRPRKVTSAPRGCAGGPALGEGPGSRRRRPVPGWRGAAAAGEAGAPGGGGGGAGSALGPVAARGASGAGPAGPRRPHPRLPPPLVSAAAPRCSPLCRRAAGRGSAALPPLPGRPSVRPPARRRSRLLPRRLSSGGRSPRPPRNRFPSASGKVKVLRRRMRPLLLDGGSRALLASWRWGGERGRQRRARPREQGALGGGRLYGQK